MSSTFISFWDSDAKGAAKEAAEALVSAAQGLRSPDDPVCPVCDTPESEGCGCNPLCCPFCGKILGAFNEDFGVDPCPHMVAWGVIGNDAISWRSKEWQARFREYGAHRSEGADAMIPGFAMKHGLAVESHDDGEGHGFGSAAHYVFQPAPKPTTPKATGKSSSPRRRTAAHGRSAKKSRASSRKPKSK